MVVLSESVHIHKGVAARGHPVCLGSGVTIESLSLFSFQDVKYSPSPCGRIPASSTKPLKLRLPTPFPYALAEARTLACAFRTSKRA